MTFPRRGEIYLVRLPGQPKDNKPRPALIVSLDVRNRLANDVIAVPISTTLRASPTKGKDGRQSKSEDSTAPGEAWGIEIERLAKPT